MFIGIIALAGETLKHRAVAVLDGPICVADIDAVVAALVWAE